MKIKEVPIGKVKAGPDDGLEEGQWTSSQHRSR